MTIQNLFVADLADILRVQLECKCGAQLSYDPDKWTNLPTKCPQCNEEWKSEHFHDLDQKMVEGFLETLKQTRRQQQGNKRVRIRLVFNQSAS